MLTTHCQQQNERNGDCHNDRVLEEHPSGGRRHIAPRCLNYDRRAAPSHGWGNSEIPSATWICLSSHELSYECTSHLLLGLFARPLLCQRINQSLELPQLLGCEPLMPRKGQQQRRRLAFVQLVGELPHSPVRQLVARDHGAKDKREVATVAGHEALFLESLQEG